MTANPRPGVTLRLPPLDAAAAAWLIDLCGQLQNALWRAHGDAIEAHWRATEPDQPIYGRLAPPPARQR